MTPIIPRDKTCWPFPSTHRPIVVTFHTAHVIILKPYQNLKLPSLFLVSCGCHRRTQAPSFVSQTRRSYMTYSSMKLLQVILAQKDAATGLIICSSRILARHFFASIVGRLFILRANEALISSAGVLLHHRELGVIQSDQSCYTKGNSQRKVHLTEV